jgi:REP element-mobilizing transposase RayT
MSKSKSKQQSFEQIPWRHRYSHGGSLRQERAGRSARPLSTRDSIHLVFKANRDVVRGGFRQSRRFALVHHLVQKYKFKFYVKVEQLSIQGDHLHLLIRTSRRSNYQSFFRVVAGQIAQQFEKEGLLTMAVTDTRKGLQDEKDFRGKPGLEKAGSAPAPARKQRKNQGVTDTPRNLARKTLIRLWKYRPFTRVVKSYRAYQTVRDYIQFNEKEAIGEISYQKRRLKGLSSSEWEVLWS